MADRYSAFAISVVAGSGHRTRNRRIVLAKSKTMAGRMALAYPGDHVKVTPAGPIDAATALFKGLRKPNARDLRSFYIELRSSLRADPSLGSAFRNVLSAIDHPAIASATLSAIDAVDRSEGTDKMLDSFLKVLPVEHVERMRAAVASGTVEEVVNQLARSADSGVKFRGKLMQALFMPAVTIVGGIAAAVFLAMTQIPAMAQLFASSKAPLPAVTQIMLDGVNVLKAYPVLAVILVLLPVAMIVFGKDIYNSSKQVQDMIDRLPIIGKLMYYTRWSRTLRTLSMLLRSNMPYEKAFNLTLKSVQHFRTHHFITGVKETMSLKAVDMYVAARASEERLGFQEAQWVSKLPLGTKTGSLGDLLDAISSDYDERSEEMMEFVPKVMELFALCVAGTLVGFVMVASTLPAFRLTNVFH